MTVVERYVHAALSASAAHRWSLCVAAPAACKGTPDHASEDAARGTVKHTLSCNGLLNVAEPESALGKTMEADGFKFKVTDEFVDQVNTYVNAIRREPGDQQYEVTLPTHTDVYQIPDRAGGTADCAIADFEREELSVHDVKFGYGRVIAIQRDAKGVAIPGTGNKQLLSYLAAWMLRYDPVAEFKKFRIAIHQPPINHYDEHTFTRAEVEEFIEYIRPRAQEAWSLYQHGTPDEIRAAMTPSDEACQWCPIRGKCPARADQIADMFDDLPQDADGDPLDAIMLDDEEIGKALLSVDEIEAHCRDVRAEGRKRALEGRKIPLHKVIQGRKGKRYWKDKEKAEAVLGAVLEPEQLYEPAEIVSPTQAEKLIKKSGMAAIKDLIGQEPGAYQLVHESEPGAEVTVIDPLNVFPEVS